MILWKTARIALILVGSFGLTACGGQGDPRVLNAEKRLANAIGDPTGARFSHVLAHKGYDGRPYLCGYIDGRTGTYPGPRRFIILLLSPADADAGARSDDDAEFGPAEPETLSQRLAFEDFDRDELKKCGARLYIEVPPDQR